MRKWSGSLVVHIGAPKTGTSSLQSWLQARKQDLAAHSIRAIFVNNISSRDIAEYFGSLQINTYYLRNEIDSVEQIVRRFRSFGTRLRLRLMLGRYRQKTTVLSSEHLYIRLTNEAAVRRLTDFLDGIFGDVRYVVYVREEESFQTGLYWEYLKNGGDWDRPEFMKRRYSPLKPETAIERWRNVVGTERLCVRDYHSLERDIIFDFALNSLGLGEGFLTGETGETGQVRRNVTPSPETMELLRNFNLENPEYDMSGQKVEGVLERRRTYVDEITGDRI